VRVYYHFLLSAIITIIAIWAMKRPLMPGKSLQRFYSSRAAPNIQELSNITQPIPKWLIGELRSDQAGETGAVQIYKGALYALNQKLKNKEPTEYETHLLQFCKCHSETEQSHLDAINAVLPHQHYTKLLTLWEFFGFTLGYVSTRFCSRGMYLTTDAVESFVEEHYDYQIDRLTRELESGEVKGQEFERLLSILQWAREDEVHHKEEARLKASEGPFMWIRALEDIWKLIVYYGSKGAAALAKKV